VIANVSLHSEHSIPADEKQNQHAKPMLEIQGKKNLKINTNACKLIRSN
jgi:hypothetical protein